MSQYDLNEMQHKLKKHLEKKRFTHTQGVRYTCAALAMCYQYDLEKAQVAGLLHDCAKAIPDEEKIQICQDNHIAISPAEMASPFLLHAKVGAYIAHKKYHIKDEDILHAIAYHTTGREKMSLLEKITYIADYIEPLRNTAPNLDAIRAAAFQDLDRTMAIILKSTLDYLKGRENEIDPLTIQAYKYYHKLCPIEEE